MQFHNVINGVTDNSRSTNQLLPVTEQGLGDTPFMRYAIDLKRKKTISFALNRNFTHWSKHQELILHSPQSKRCVAGQWIPLLSVSRLLKVSPENPIITEPYIKTTNELNKKWSGILGAKEKPVVGITWQGNPRIEKGSLRGRSLALETFAPIADSSQISILSLQKGFGSEQMETCTFKNRFGVARIKSITPGIPGNSCNHFQLWSSQHQRHLCRTCGGMGKTTWLLLQRFLIGARLKGDTTFWYPL